MSRYGMLVDRNRCIGCYACRTACQINHALAPTESFVAFEHEETGVFPDVVLRTAPRQCAHCDSAPCAGVCPTGATYRGDDGLVHVDEARCIGCGYCAVACPFGVRVRRENGTFAKCSFCAERLGEGLEPYCAVTCPVGARVFGDLDDTGGDLVREIAQRRAEPFGGDLTGAHVYYAR